MCIRINGDINDVAEMYLDNELRSIKSFLEEVLDLPGRPTINELLGAVKHELHEDEEVETKEKSVFFVSHGYFVRGQRNTDYNWSLLAEFDNMDSAKEYIKSIRTDPVQQLVYGPDGYGIRI